MHVWQHFRTVTRHKWLVLTGCFRVGLYIQGITHDLSKFSPTEFRNGAKYFQGTRSPNAAERDDKGYSEAWMHHKGRNRHHYEYWTDLDKATRTYRPIPMPRRYLVESVMDRRAACMVYQGKDYTDESPLKYHQRSWEKAAMHPQTDAELTAILTMLAKKGERETFRFLRETVLPGVPLEQWPGAEA